MAHQAEIQKEILNLLKKAKPDTVEEFIKQAEEELGIPNEKILEHILLLEKKGKMKLTSPSRNKPSTISEYLLSENAIWFWAISSLSITAIISILLIPENAFPIVIIRYTLSTIFLLVTPGFTFIKMLYPTKEIDNIDFLILSIGTSLSLIILIGLFLNYTVWGLRLIPIIISLMILTIPFTIIGLYREFYETTKIIEMDRL